MEKLLYEVAATSDVGQVRSNNEDALFCDCNRGLFLVCDGMGGQQAGEVASDLAITTISSVVCANPPRRLDEVDQLFSTPIQPVVHTHLCRSNVTDAASLSTESQLVKHAIEVANARIHSAAETVDVQKGMGTTVAAVLFDSDTATVAHVGDSRVYLFRNQGLQLLTNDHSVGAEQLRAGVSAEEVSNHPYKHFLTRADEACVSLIEAAKNNGSSDNITCVLIKVQAAAQPVESVSGLVDLWEE
jgi:serine/threonine protein phosphatase PrpC